ncbi:unnamed protein product [Gongylonema pulchrum]|uniref:Mediator of RNA polymerase II transcription subunit 7 n=1 Tax=Gongylonema pulchrum TaxID=637853 RepID=A0A3P6T3V0_9BILA|nr:unnamed protein product [Gongylonema pulchrum]
MEKINNLRLLFINMHHLINEYRPLQARDTLQVMMKAQIKSIEVRFFLLPLSSEQVLVKRMSYSCNFLAE